MAFEGIVLVFAYDAFSSANSKVLHVVRGDTADAFFDWTYIRKIDSFVCGERSRQVSRESKVESWVQVERLIDVYSSSEDDYCIVCLKNASLIMMANE